MFGFFRKKKPVVAHASSMEEASQLLQSATSQGRHVMIDLSEIEPEDLGELFSAVSHKKKLGRNDLCPCGSGVKYKRCCLRH